MYIAGDADRHSTGFTDVTRHALDETHRCEMSLIYLIRVNFYNISIQTLSNNSI